MKENGTFYGESQKTLAGGARAALIPEGMAAPTPTPAPYPAAARGMIITPLAVWQDFMALSCSKTEQPQLSTALPTASQLGTDCSKQMIQRTKAPVLS